MTEHHQSRATYMGGAAYIGGHAACMCGCAAYMGGCAVYLGGFALIRAWQRVSLVADTQPHKLVPRRMKFNFVDAVTKPIVGVQHRRVTVREFSEFQSFRLAEQRAELTRAFFHPAPTLARDSL